MKATDFLQDDDGDLLIANGDFVFGESDADHIQDIIQSFPGEWKQYPLVGVGVFQYLSSSGQQQQLQQQTTLQLKADGYNVKKIVFDFDPSGTITFTSDAERIL